MTDINDYQLKVTTSQEGELSDFEKTRINMAYNFFCETIKKNGGTFVPKKDVEAMAQNSVGITDTLLKALGYKQDSSDD